MPEINELISRINLTADVGFCDSYQYLYGRRRTEEPEIIEFCPEGPRTDIPPEEFYWKVVATGTLSPAELALEEWEGKNFEVWRAQREQLSDLIRAMTRAAMKKIIAWRQEVSGV